MQVSLCGLDVSYLCIILYKIYSCVVLYKMFTLLPIKYTYIDTISDMSLIVTFFQPLRSPQLVLENETSWDWIRPNSNNRDGGYNIVATTCLNSCVTPPFQLPPLIINEQSQVTCGHQIVGLWKVYWLKDPWHTDKATKQEGFNIQLQLYMMLRFWQM